MTNFNVRDERKSFLTTIEELSTGTFFVFTNKLPIVVENMLHGCSLPLDISDIIFLKGEHSEDGWAYIINLNTGIIKDLDFSDVQTEELAYYSKVEPLEDVEFAIYR